MKIVEKPKENTQSINKPYVITYKNEPTGHITKIYVNNTFIGNIINLPSNCKFSVIDYISYAWDKNKEIMKRNIDTLLKNCRLSVLIQTNALDTINFLQEHYDVYSLVSLPIGYNSGFQYHITLRNNLTKDNNFHYARSSKKVQIKNADSLNNEIIQIFKNKRRKTDIVPEIINIIKSKS